MIVAVRVMNIGERIVAGMMSVVMMLRAG